MHGWLRAVQRLKLNNTVLYVNICKYVCMYVFAVGTEHFAVQYVRTYLHTGHRAPTDRPTAIDENMRTPLTVESCELRTVVNIFLCIRFFT